MDAKAAAQRWADTWARAWPRRVAEAIAALYADTVVYRSPAFRPPDLGLAGVRRYLSEQLPVEQDIECWFGQPIVSGDRAAVEWWASWTEQGQELTDAGVTVLHFDDQGQVVEHRDYDNRVERRESPYPGWCSAQVQQPTARYSGTKGLWRGTVRRTASRIIPAL